MSVLGGSSDLELIRACCIITALFHTSSITDFGETRTYSIITKAVMASTIGTARGTTQGSCLPRASKTPSVPS